MTDPVRLLIVDDDPLVRAGLTIMLGGRPEVSLVGEAADGTEVAAAVAACAPDVVLTDIRMPGLDGLRATELLRARPRAPEVIVLTTFHTDAHVLRALRAGASGFLLKDTPPADILHAVLRVAAGDPILSPTVTRQLITHLGNAGSDARPRPTRPRALHERGHREGPRLLDTDQAGPEQPHPTGHPRPRRRPDRRTRVLRRGGVHTGMTSTPRSRPLKSSVLRV